MRGLKVPVAVTEFVSPCLRLEQIDAAQRRFKA
jgi:hypothetical protein